MLVLGTQGFQSGHFSWTMLLCLQEDVGRALMVQLGATGQVAGADNTGTVSLEDYCEERRVLDGSGSGSGRCVALVLPSARMCLALCPPGI